MSVGSTLYYNGIILTQNKVEPVVSAMVVKEGRILWVGVGEPADFSGTKVDLRGRTLMPGFNDAHIHLWKVGQLAAFIIDLRGVGSIVELQIKVKSVAAHLPAGRWIVGRGFNEAVLAERRIPSAKDLDAISTAHPIYLIRTCAHIAVTNSLAMEKAGIQSGSVAPEGGVIGKDDDGQLTGLFYETALGLVTRHIPATTQEDYRKMIEAGVGIMLQNGITSLTDPAAHPELIQAYRTYASGDPSIRMNVMPILLPDGGEEPYPIPPIYHSPFLHVDTVKFFSDGGLSGKTASLSRPYRNSSDHGVLRLSFSKFYPLAREAQHKGFRIGTHAIGDCAIGVVLEVYKKLFSEFGDRRNRIEHFGLPTHGQVEEVAHHKFVVVTQPVFLGELGENFVQALDEAYLSQCYPLASLLQKDIPLAFSTDAPVVAQINPWYNIQCAILRTSQKGSVIAPNESVSLEQAIHGYTVGGAYAEGRELEKGMIIPGHLADFIVLDRNPHTTPVHLLHQIVIEETYVNGILRWKK